MAPCTEANKVVFLRLGHTSLQGCGQDIGFILEYKESIWEVFHVVHCRFQLNLITLLWHMCFEEKTES